MAAMSSSSFSRHGAVDLSQVAQRAKQAGAAPGATAGGTGSYVVEATEQTFEAEAIRKSVKHPVVVELYSPRVATGQKLSDALAALAAESAGRFLLVRVNVDSAPGIVQALGLQAVPTVIAVIGGQIAPLFQGVLSKEQASAYLEQMLKAAVANGIVGRAEPVAAGAGAAADAQPDEPPASDPRFAAADEALDKGDFAAAAAEFDKLLQANPNDAEAKAGKAQAGLLARVSVLDPRAAVAAAATSTDLIDQLAAADAEMVTGQAEAAFDRLIDVVRRSSGEDRNTARVRLLELFETLGSSDPRVLKARRDLMAALF
jgi:putative thioredoxin